MVGFKVLAVLAVSVPAIVRGSLIDDIIDSIEHAVDCGACLALLVPLQALVNAKESAITNIIADICTAFKIYDKDVCDGLLQQQGPVLAQAIKKMSPFSSTAAKFCNAGLGLCQSPAASPFKVPFPKAAPSNPKAWVSKGNPPFQVSHFSDVHIDRQYTPGTESVCNKPICCRKYPDYPHAHTPSGETASLNCDSSPALAHSMLRAIPNNKFSLYTGDTVDTAVWMVSEDYNVNEMKTFNDEMATFLKSPVYSAIGNHDAAPLNMFPRNTTVAHASDVQWLFDTQASGWSQWLDADAQSQIRHFSGSYVQVVPGTLLRIISLNTNYWYKFNFYLYDSEQFQPNPNGILEFLVQQLQAAEDAGHRAWIIGHMPPGNSDALYDQSNYFDEIVQRYKNTIAAQFYGHTHMDQFQIAYSDYSQRSALNAVSVAMIAPALTSREGNPGFKHYDIDPDTYEIMDVTIYRGDITDPSFQANATWSKYYTARKTWGSLVGWPASQPLTPAFWHKLTEVFETNDHAFQEFLTFLHRGINIPPCDAACRSTFICGMRAQRAENNCVVATPGLNYIKRSDIPAASSLPYYGSCGVHLGHILSRLPPAFAQARQGKIKVDVRAIVARHVEG